jgi:hypothetical protein
MSGVSEEEPAPTSPPSHLSRRREEERCGAVAAGSSHLLARGRRSGAAQGRSKPLVAVSGLPLRKLRMLANHC